MQKIIEQLSKDKNALNKEIEDYKYTTHNLIRISIFQLLIIFIVSIYLTVPTIYQKFFTWSSGESSPAQIIEVPEEGEIDTLDEATQTPPLSKHVKDNQGNNNNKAIAKTINEPDSTKNEDLEKINIDND